VNVQNRTDGKHLALPMKDREGRAVLAVIVKYTYKVAPNGRVERDDDGPEPRAIDAANGEDPAKSSIKYPSELYEWKPGTDVVLVADAYGRAGANYADVSLKMGPVQKSIRAHGFRVWQRGMLGGLVPGPAMPLRAPIPIQYELAWGGEEDMRNTVGTGATKTPAQLVNQPAAQLELAGKPLGERAGTNLPASFGPIHRHWQPRVTYAGTYDKAWEETRMPLLPADFDPRFHVCVPPDQWSPQPLWPNEPIEVLGGTEDGAFRVALPSDAPKFSSLFEGKRREHPTHLDLVVIDARERRVELTWRVAIPLPLKLEMLAEVRIQ
jgi:hypothetical protein